MAKQRTAKPKATNGAKVDVNKSDVIRDILKANKAAKVKEIRGQLEERGIKASDALINKIKYGRNGNGAKKARNGSQLSKADAIRNMLSEMGLHARSRDVIAALSKRGVEVSSAHVSTLRKTLNTRGLNGAHVSTHAISLDHILAAKTLVERLGSIGAARQALDSLARIMDA